MKRERRRMKRNKVIDLPITQEDDKSLELEERLLPGICDEVTLDLITPKLHWTTFYTLSSICSAWQQAIRDRLVYDARVRSHSAETLVLVRAWFGDEIGMALYSLREKTCCRLPPCREDGDLMERSCIALDGKIYLLGGLKRPTSLWNGGRLLSNNKVHVLDLAGQRQWKQCASMPITRTEFGFGFIDGKIYVFGGTTTTDYGTSHVSCADNGPEVYDPSVNEWSAIQHMPGGLRCYNAVASAGEELFVYGGYRYSSDDDELEDAYDLMAYCPGTGKWRTLSKNVGFDRKKADLETFGFTQIFMAQGKFYCMSVSAIDVYDIDQDSWTLLHSFSLEGIIEGVPYDAECVIHVKPVDNELLAMMSWDVFNDHRYLIRSKGFGSGVQEIVWELAPSSDNIRSLICTLTL